KEEEDIDSQLKEIEKVIGTKSYNKELGDKIRNKIHEWNIKDGKDYFFDEHQIKQAYEKLEGSPVVSEEENIEEDDSDMSEYGNEIKKFEKNPQEKAEVVKEEGTISVVENQQVEEVKNKGKEKFTVDMPVNLVAELIKTSGKENKILENIFEEQGEVSKEIIKGIFDNLSTEQEKVLKEVLENSGRTLDEFIKDWKESGWGEKVVETIKQKIETTCKNEAAEKIGMWDRFKADWKNNLLKVGIIGGVAITAAIAAPAGLVAAGVLTAGATTGVAIGAGISAGGVVGRFINKIFKQKKEKEKAFYEITGDAEYEGKENKNLRKTQEIYLAQIKEKFAKDLKSSGMNISDYFGSLISQGVVESTSSENQNPNSEVLRRHIMEVYKTEGGIEGEQKAQLEELLTSLSDRKTLTEELSKSKDPKIIEYLKVLSETKSGSLFMNEGDPSKIKEALGYLAPLLLGGAVGTACQLSGTGAVSMAIRSGLLGAAGAYMGYRLGESADIKDRRKGIIKDIKNKMQEVEGVLKKHQQGAKIEVNNLKVDVENLAAMLQTGVLEKDPVLVTRTEALIREGQKVFFELNSEKKGEKKLTDLLLEMSKYNDDIKDKSQDIVKKIASKSNGTKRIVYSIAGAVAGAAGMYKYLDNQEQIKEVIGQAYAGTKEYLGFETQKPQLGAVETAAIASQVKEGVEPTDIKTQIKEGLEPTDIKTQVGIPQELKKVHSGDSFEKIFKRQIFDNPNKFGYEGEGGKDLEGFINTKAHEFLKQNNLWENGRGKGLEYNSKAEVTLNSDGTWKGNEHVKVYDMEVPKIEELPLEEISNPRSFEQQLETVVMQKGYWTESVEKALHKLEPLKQSSPNLYDNLVKQIEVSYSKFSEAETTLNSMQGKSYSNSLFKGVSSDYYTKDLESILMKVENEIPFINSDETRVIETEYSSGKSVGSKDNLASDISKLSKKSGLTGDNLAEKIFEHKIPGHSEIKQALEDAATKGDKTATKLLNLLENNSKKGHSSLNTSVEKMY
ncbi:MAG: hypothetical protein Q7J14_01280, partial [Candidatus Magasanikbacteria bacterium]|nr:hypothetical protein [Candidatus Magasanikbacteria bacterium]